MMTKNNVRDPKFIAIASVGTVLVVILVIIMAKSFLSSSQDRDILNKLVKPVKYNESTQNAISCDILATTDQYVFYTDKKGLNRVDKNGTNKLEIDTGLINNLNIYNNSLYYSKNVPKEGDVRNSNKDYTLIKASLDGKTKDVMVELQCQAINSMLAIEEMLLYKPVVFKPDGGVGDTGEPTGELKNTYKAFDMKMKKNVSIEADLYEDMLRMQYLFTQSEIDGYLNQEYTDMMVKSSSYTINNKLYFDAQKGIQNRDEDAYIAVFCIDKKDNKPVIVAKYQAQKIEGVRTNVSVRGFSYSQGNLYYTLTEARGKESKVDLYKINESTNQAEIVTTLYQTEGFK